MRDTFYSGNGGRVENDYLNKNNSIPANKHRQELFSKIKGRHRT